MAKNGNQSKRKSIKKFKFSKSETSRRFQGTAKDVAARMDRDPAFAAGMKEHYGVDRKDLPNGNQSKNGKGYKAGE